MLLECHNYPKDLAMKLIYDTICCTLTNYEEGVCSGKDLYNLLVEIQGL